MTGPNALFASFFRDEIDYDIDFYTSLDGIHFNSINSESLPRDNGEVKSRDPAIIWYDGMWWVFVTSPALGKRDLAIYTIDQSLFARRHNCVLGSSAFGSKTAPAPGGSVPVDALWAPEPFIDFDGTLCLTISVPFYPGDSENKAIFSSRLTGYDGHGKPLWSEPERLSIPAIEGEGAIDASIRSFDGFQYLTCKSGGNRDTMKIFKRAITETEFTLVATVQEPAFSIEAPSMTPYYRLDQKTGAIERKIRLYCDNNRTTYDPGEPDSWRLMGRVVYYEADSPEGPYGPVQFAYTDRPARHGTIVNLRDVNDPAATLVVEQLAAFGRQSGERPCVRRDLPEHLHPQANVIYETGSSSDVSEVGVGAERFFIFVADGHQAMLTGAVQTSLTPGLYEYRLIGSAYYPVNR